MHVELNAPVTGKQAGVVGRDALSDFALTCMAVKAPQDDWQMRLCEAGRFAGREAFDADTNEARACTALCEPVAGALLGGGDPFAAPIALLAARTLTGDRVMFRRALLAACAFVERHADRLRELAAYLGFIADAGERELPHDWTTAQVLKVIWRDTRPLTKPSQAARALVRSIEAGDSPNL